MAASPRKAPGRGMPHLSKRAFELTASLVVACSPEATDGGITADIVFDDDPARSGGALLTSAVPDIVGRLEIRAQDPAGFTLAETVLDVQPGPGEERLVREGGTWTLRNVRAGADRTIIGEGFARSQGSPFDGSLAYEGRIDHITVFPGEVQDAGTIVLNLSPNAPRELDVAPPLRPTFEVVRSADGGEGIVLLFAASPSSDTRGYVVAVGTSSAAPTIARNARPTVGESLRPNLEIQSMLGEAPAN